MDLATGNFLAFRKVGKLILRVMIVPGIILEFDDDNSNSVTSYVSSSIYQDRMIIVANKLPLKAHKRSDNRGQEFSWDEDYLPL
jgi:trehalose 6-phosphate synthase/phosphatase